MSALPIVIVKMKGYLKMKENKQAHTHVAEDGSEYTHSHSDEHRHMHSHKNTKAVINRLSRATGHLESVKRMVEEGKDCSEVLIQLSAVIAALNNTGKVILKDHMEHCIVDAVESGDKEAIDNLNKAIDSFIK
jgi:DNA-binding FrmR family transcriptional regulator